MVAIVMLPGLDGTGQLLGDFILSLGPDADTLLVAYPTDSEIAYEDLAEFVLQSLPGDKPFVLVAESFSGPVAARVAMQRPSGLVGVVFCASFVSSPLPALRRFAALLRFAPVRAIPAAVLAVFLLGRWSSEAHVTGLRRALASVQPRVLRSRARAALTAAQPPDFGIHVPVLYLRAEFDRLISRASIERLRRAAPSVTVVSIAGPHFLLQAAPEACAAAISSFASSVVPAT
jgi:pimeloyl-[acyl-carrier protein] methyl ester esterase